MEGNNSAARPHFAESLAIFRKYNDKEAISASLNNLGAVDYDEGNYESARLYFVEGLVLARELRDKIGIAYFLDGFAALAYSFGEFSSAAQLAGASEHLRELIGYEIDLIDSRFRETCLAQLKTKFNKTDFRKFYEQGLKMKLEEAISLALGIR